MKQIAIQSLVTDNEQVAELVLFFTQPWHLPGRDDTKLEGVVTTTQIDRFSLVWADEHTPHDEQSWLDALERPNRPHYTPANWLAARDWLRLAAGRQENATVTHVA